MDFKALGSLGSEATVANFEKYFVEELISHDVNKKESKCNIEAIKETLSYLLEELDAGVAGVLRIANVRKIVHSLSFNISL